MCKGGFSFLVDDKSTFLLLDGCRRKKVVCGKREREKTYISPMVCGL